MAAGEESAPLLYGPKAQVRKALEANRIRYTYIVAYGLASYWANGLGELGQRNRVPPAPTGHNKVPYYGNGRTKCECHSGHTHLSAIVWKCACVKHTVLTRRSRIQAVLQLRVPMITKP